jgi:hypothetical protein
MRSSVSRDRYIRFGPNPPDLDSIGASIIKLNAEKSISEVTALILNDLERLIP